MLAAMRPHDARYAAIALPAGSPDVRCQRAAACHVLAGDQSFAQRYRHAKRTAAQANPPEWGKGIIARHDSYWRNEANMAEGNPMLALERGEKLKLPPAIWFQAKDDTLHDYKDPEGFPGQRAAALRRQLQVRPAAISRSNISRWIARHGHTPDLSKTGDMFARMVQFIGKHIKA